MYVVPAVPLPRYPVYRRGALVPTLYRMGGLGMPYEDVVRWKNALRGKPGLGSFLGTLPQSTVSAFHGPADTMELMAKQALGPSGEQSMLVRQFTEWAIRGVQPKDYLGELLALRNIFVQPSPFPGARGGPLFHYTNDPRHVEMVKTPERMVREIMEHGSTVIDCDETAELYATMAMQIGREVELVALGFAPGRLSHVGARAKEPKSGTWIWADGVAGPREREAAARAVELEIRGLRSLD